jgi:hypothetical protein
MAAAKRALDSADAKARNGDFPRGGTRYFKAVEADLKAYLADPDAANAKVVADAAVDIGIAGTKWLYNKIKTPEPPPAPRREARPQPQKLYPGRWRRDAEGRKYRSLRDADGNFVRYEDY